MSRRRENLVEQERSPNGRYIRFDEKLGHGAYKDVWLSYDTETGLEVAWNTVDMKRLPLNEKKRVSFETTILSRLKHPHIINFYDSWENREREQICFTTEIVTSGTLKQYISRIKRVKLKVIKKWCRQILSGLDYLHSHDPPIIHRDLKCDNIFINGSTSEIRIGDFGLSATRAATHVKSVLGTPEFMAPELYDEVYNEKVDIYAFGMCLLEMTTNEYPYQECTNAAQIWKKVSSGIKPEAINKIANIQVRSFLDLCLTDKEHRLSAHELLQHPFLTYQECDPRDNLIVRLAGEESSELSEQEQAAALAIAAAAKAPPIDPLSQRVVVSADVVVEPTDKPTVAQVSLEIHFEDRRKKQIKFEFNFDSDTANEVAAEMVAVLELPGNPTKTIALIAGNIQAKLDEFRGVIHVPVPKRTVLSAIPEVGNEEKFAINVQAPAGVSSSDEDYSAPTSYETPLPTPTPSPAQPSSQPQHVSVANHSVTSVSQHGSLVEAKPAPVVEVPSNSAVSPPSATRHTPTLGLSTATTIAPPQSGSAPPTPLTDMPRTTVSSPTSQTQSVASPSAASRTTLGAVPEAHEEAEDGLVSRDKNPLSPSHSLSSADSAENGQSNVGAFDTNGKTNDVPKPSTLAHRKSISSYSITDQQRRASLVNTNSSSYRSLPNALDADATENLILDMDDDGSRDDIQELQRLRNELTAESAAYEQDRKQAEQRLQALEDELRALKGLFSEKRDDWDRRVAWFSSEEKRIFDRLQARRDARINAEQSHGTNGTSSNGPRAPGTSTSGVGPRNLKRSKEDNLQKKVVRESEAQLAQEKIMAGFKL